LPCNVSEDDFRRNVLRTKNPVNRFFTKRLMMTAVVLLAGIFAVIFFENQPHPRLAPGQKPLIDIKNIDTLRTQFNHDAGKTRLIILVSPT
jgi:hypothetical protein